MRATKRPLWDFDTGGYYRSLPAVNRGMRFGLLKQNISILDIYAKRRAEDTVPLTESRALNAAKQYIYYRIYHFISEISAFLFMSAQMPMMILTFRAATPAALRLMPKCLPPGWSAYAASPRVLGDKIVSREHATRIMIFALPLFLLTCHHRLLTADIIQAQQRLIARIKTHFDTYTHTPDADIAEHFADLSTGKIIWRDLARRFAGADEALRCRHLMPPSRLCHTKISGDAISRRSHIELPQKRPTMYF